MFKKISLGCVILAVLAVLAPRRAEANCGGAAIVGGLIGLFIGSAVQAQACECHQRQCDRAGYQRHLMREVLQNYDARRHPEFIEYVTIDLEGWLTAHQQQQLVDIMQQRRICYLQDNYCAVR